MSHHPAMLVRTGHVEPAPRRVRAVLAGRTVVDTSRALYAWDGMPYPGYYLPLADVDETLLVDEGTTRSLPVGEAGVHSLVVGEQHRPGAAAVVTASEDPRLVGTVRLEWGALDAWYGERRSSSTPATPTPASTRCARAAGCASSATAWCWPRPPHRCWSSRAA